jgi:glucose-1-phosphate thymidylyltransferase
MNALILAAGYGKRMGEITRTTAKPLLPVNGKPVIQHLADQLFSTGKIDHLTVISNAYYYGQFAAWVESLNRDNVTLLNDGSTTNENRLGAIADLKLAAEQAPPRGPLLVMAGDNIYTFPLGRFIDFYEQKQTDCVVARHLPDIGKLRKTGVVSLDSNHRIVDFEEKPERPKSEYGVPCMYILTPPSLLLIGEYIDVFRHDRSKSDAPGNFIAWLHTQTPVHAYRFHEPLHCIGDKESYARVQQAFSS